MRHASRAVAHATSRAASADIAVALRRTRGRGARACSTQAVASTDFGPVAEHDSFAIVKSVNVPDYHCHATLYQHRRTGGQVLSLQSAETNKVFGVNFRTPVSDSTGVPHVLEHSVLCGSDKYPLKEPFVELLKSSVQTFLNAFTYPDRTCYPVASQNTKDFYNLVDVYMDAVFHPRLTPQVLQQEGWHLEVEPPTEGDTASAQLSYQGVVFNEMKGVFSSASSVHHEQAQSALFPDTTYRHCSGGDPAAIPDLTFEQFSGFHQQFYHPSNAYVYFYGDDDPATRLQIVDEYFKDYEARPADDSEVEVQKLWSEPRKYEGTYPASADCLDKHMASVHWVMSETQLDSETQVAWVLLDMLLLGTHASPLVKALTDSNLGDDVIGGGCDDTLRQPTYSIGLKGVAEADVAKVEELVMQVLSHHAEHGFDHDHIEGCMNSLEFRVREPHRGGHGLGLMLGTLPHWMHYSDAVDVLFFEEPLRRVRETVLSEGSTLLQDLLRKYLLENTHKLSVHLRPDAEYTKKREAQEAARLAETERSMQEDDFARIAAEAEALVERQTKPDAPELLAKVPTLGLEDLDRQAQIVPRDVREVGSTTLLMHDQPTQKILHVALGFDMSGLSERHLPLLPLFLRCVRELPTATTDEVTMSRRIDSHTGGVGLNSSVSPMRASEEDLAAYVFISGKALEHKVEHLTDVMAELLLTTDFRRRDLIKSIVKEAVASKEAALVSSGNSVVGSHITSLLSKTGWVNAHIGGLPYLHAMRDLLKRIDSDFDSVVADLEEMRAAVLRGRSLASVTADSATLASAQPHVDRLLAATTGTYAAADPAAWAWKPQAGDNVGTAFLVPTQVNYVGKGVRLCDPTQEVLGGHTAVIDNILRTSWLWEQVRVTGGAYGASAGFDRFTGNFVCSSYRDPNLVSTLAAFDGTAAILRDSGITDEDVRKAIISTVGSLDSPITPADKGAVSLSRYLAGITDEEVQRRRDEIFGTTTAHLVEFGERLEAMRGDDAVAAAVTSEDALKAEPAASELLPRLQRLL